LSGCGEGPKPNVIGRATCRKLGRAVGNLADLSIEEFHADLTDCERGNRVRLQSDYRLETICRSRDSLVHTENDMSYRSGAEARL
jgi:hypothetical protein